MMSSCRALVKSCRLALVLAIVASLLLTGCASLRGESSHALSRIVESGVLRVGMSGNQPPLNATSRTGELIGMEADLARMLANAMGVRAELIAKPFPELLDALEAGEFDMVISGITITPPRNMVVAFAGPYFISGKSILTRSETLARATRPSDINDTELRLAALAGSTSQLFVEGLIPQATLVPTQSYDEGITLLRTGKVHALVADFPICLLSALKYRDEGLVTLAAPLSVEPVGIALPANDPLFINLVQNYVNALQQTGLLTELRAHWFDDAGWMKRLRER